METNLSDEYNFSLKSNEMGFFTVTNFNMYGDINDINYKDLYSENNFLSKNCEEKLKSKKDSFDLTNSKKKK